MKLYIARHCESEYNVQKRLNSDPNIKVSLTEKGFLQAKELATKLKDIDFKLIYVSELLRTQQTAEIVNEYHNKPIVIEPKLNDNKSGYEGQNINEYIKAIESSNDGLNVVFGDGESLQEVIYRVKEFVYSLRKTSQTPCLIVTSGYIIECLYGLSNKVPPEVAASFSIPQGDYTTLNI